MEAKEAGDNRLKSGLTFSVAEIMKREADAGAMTGSGGPTSPHKRYRQGDDELRLLIPSKVRFYQLFPQSWRNQFRKVGGGDRSVGRSSAASF